jgi:SsrA-binding protein
VRERGVTLVPLELYFKGALVKVRLGLARGKKQHDKRAVLKERDAKREIDRALRRDR